MHSLASIRRINADAVLAAKAKHQRAKRAGLATDPRPEGPRVDTVEVNPRTGARVTISTHPLQHVPHEQAQSRIMRHVRAAEDVQ